MLSARGSRGSSAKAIVSAWGAGEQASDRGLAICPYRRSSGVLAETVSACSLLHGVFCSFKRLFFINGLREIPVSDCCLLHPKVSRKIDDNFDDTRPWRSTWQSNS